MHSYANPEDNSKDPDVNSSLIPEFIVMHSSADHDDINFFKVFYHDWDSDSTESEFYCGGFRCHCQLSFRETATNTELRIMANEKRFVLAHGFDFKNITLEEYLDAVLERGELSRCSAGELAVSAEFRELTIKTYLFRKSNYNRTPSEVIKIRQEILDEINNDERNFDPENDRVRDEDTYESLNLEEGWDLYSSHPMKCAGYYCHCCFDKGVMRRYDQMARYADTYVSDTEDSSSDLSEVCSDCAQATKRTRSNSAKYGSDREDESAHESEPQVFTDCAQAAMKRARNNSIKFGSAPVPTADANSSIFKSLRSRTIFY